MIRSSKSASTDFLTAFLAVSLSLAAWSAASAQQPGITDTEIKFGNIMPYSGPASALSVTGKVFAAYFDMINEKGGVSGRKLNMIVFRRRRQSRRRAGWWRMTVSLSCSAPWARRQVRQQQSISTAPRCRISFS
jgi:hypothetical protein